MKEYTKIKISCLIAIFLFLFGCWASAQTLTEVKMTKPLLGKTRSEGFIRYDPLTKMATIHGESFPISRVVWFADANCYILYHKVKVGKQWGERPLFSIYPRRFKWSTYFPLKEDWLIINED